VEDCVEIKLETRDWILQVKVSQHGRVEYANETDWLAVKENSGAPPESSIVVVLDQFVIFTHLCIALEHH